MGGRSYKSKFVGYSDANQHKYPAVPVLRTKNQQVLPRFVPRLIYSLKQERVTQYVPARAYGHTHTHARADKSKRICSNFFKVLVAGWVDRWMRFLPKLRFVSTLKIQCS